MFIAVIDGRVDKNENLIEQLRDCFDLLHRQVVEAQQGQPTSDSSVLVESRARASSKKALAEPYLPVFRWTWPSVT